MAAIPDPGPPPDRERRWLDPAGVERRWLPFTVAWALTAWLPLGIWALPSPAYRSSWLGPTIDSLLSDLPLALLASAVYVGPWLWLVRPRSTSTLGLSRALATGLVAVLTGALLAMAPQDHQPPERYDACWETPSLAWSAADRRWCDERAAVDLWTGAALGLAGLGCAALAFASARFVPRLTDEAFPSKIPPPDRQDPQTLAVLALALTSLFAPLLGLLGAALVGGALLLIALGTWLFGSTAAIVYGSWLSGQGIGREPARSVALGLAWLAHLWPLMAGLVLLSGAGARWGPVLFGWAMVGGWLLAFARGAARLATPELDYDEWIERQSR